MWTILFVFITTVNALQEEKEKFIAVTYLNNKTGFEVKMSFGIHAMQETFIVDQSMNFSSTTRYAYTTQDECSALEQNILLYESELMIKKVFDCEGFFNIGDYEFLVPKFHFYLSSGTYRQSMWLGLGRNFNNNFSLIDMLYKNNKIGKLMYGFVPEKNKERYYGMMYFGEIPKRIKDKKRVGKCKIKNKNIPTWNVNLSKIDINGNEFINTYETHINCNTYSSFVPNEYFTFLINKVFKDFTDKYRCVQISINGDMTFRCSKEILSYPYNIQFIIDNYVYQVKMKNFFNCESGKCDFLLMSNESTNKKFILGTTFIDNFDMIEFDYESNEIILYSQDSIITKEEYDHIRMKIKNTIRITLINDFLLFIMIIIFSIIKTSIKE